MTQWHAIPEEDRREIGALCTDYGAQLIDYSRTELAEADAALVTCAALLSAYTHADRLAAAADLRAWLYALTRAHRTHTAAASPTSTGSWKRPTPGVLPDLVPEALATLEAPHREALDLAHRHDLSTTEIGLIFDTNPAHVATTLAAAEHALEIWFAAVTAAEGVGGCDQLAVRVAEWSAAPMRRTRTQISRHIGECTTCQQAPRTATAAELMTQLEPLPAPEGFEHDLAEATPLSNDPDQWRPDGFPTQVHGLAEAEAVPLLPDTPATAEGDGARADQLKAGSAGTASDTFRAWDERANNSGAFFAARPEPEYREDPEMWAARADESDAEAHFSARSVLRVGAVTVVGVALALLVVKGLFATGETPRVVQAAPRGDAAALPTTTSPTVLLELPPDEDNTPVVVITTAVAPTNATKPTGKPTSRPTTKPASKTQTPKPTAGGPSEPPHQGDKPTTKPSTKPTAKPTATTSADPTKAPPTTKPPLPKPAAPTASVSGGGTLGTGRSGSFSLSVSPGTGSITGASGSTGISVSGSSFTVTAPASYPGCDGPKTGSGTITVSWAGTNTGDGVATEGTTSGGGSLTLSVSWTVKEDKGYLVGDGHGGEYYSNCSH